MKSLSLYAAKGITTLSSLFFTIYIAKIAGVEYFGVFNLMLMVTFIFNLVSDWGFPIYGPTEINNYNSHEEKREYLARITRFRFFASIIVTVAYVLLIALFYSKYFYLLILGVPVIFTNFMNTDWVSRSFQSPEVSSIRQVVNAVLNVTFILIIFYLKLPLTWAFFTYSVSIVVSFAVGIFLLSKRAHITYLNFWDFSNLRKSLTEIFTRTRYAFLGLLVSNVLYSLSIPLLSRFSTSYDTSIYSSYYAVFSSAAAIILITQDIYIPKFKLEDKAVFFSKYTSILIIASFILTLILLLIPFYFHFLFPPSFKVDYKLVQLFGFLSFLFFLRVLVVNASMLMGEYRNFYFSNLGGLVAFVVSTVALIANGNLTALTSLCSLLFSEVIVISMTVVLNMKNFRFLVNVKLAVFVLVVIVCLFMQLLLPNSYGYILLVMLVPSFLFFLMYSLRLLSEKKTFLA